MKVAVLVLANDEICTCSKCIREGRSASYDVMINAVRKTWADSDVEGFNTYYIYGHRKGIEFPDDWPCIESNETYWPVSKGEGGTGVNITKKRAPYAIEDCIYSDTPEGRENIYYKTVDGFQWLLENTDFDYVLRCCAGTYLDLKMIKQLLDNIGVKDDIYCGSLASYPNNHENNKTSQPHTIKYASGSAFIASRNLIQNLVNNRNSIDVVRSRYASATIVDDPTFGHHFMNFCGVKNIISWTKFECSHPYEINMMVKDQLQCYFKHTINPDLMYQIHRFKGGRLR
tara:strand:+ start:67 stop:924 length:858 start_codon:yes stop_codon:yes gene_type:complete